MQNKVFQVHMLNETHFRPGEHRLNGSKKKMQNASISEP